MRIFEPQQYQIQDVANQPFIDKEEIRKLLEQKTRPSIARVREILSKSLNKKRLTLQETAVLLLADDPISVQEIKEAAKALKRRIYGNRIVLFAPLYIGNRCSNDCIYCGFRSSNRQAIRHTLSREELIDEVKALERNGHKRLILVYGEHPLYNAQFIADTVRTVYSVKEAGGEIRRVNINAAPFDVEGFRTIKEAGIGTFQIFQESYDPGVYCRWHPAGRKSDYTYRLTALDRAMEAGIDDVGIGALIGLGDWRFEVLGLIRHVNHLEACFGVGPHTISFPRIKEASQVDSHLFHPVSDEDFVRMIAILRLAVPYTGLILTAREPRHVRYEAMQYGISQIDGGTRIEIGGYSKAEKQQHLNREQFRINDDRSLSDVMEELIQSGYVPSFCTACYRKQRTGEHFMEFSVPGFIKRFCTPNALFSLAEYLEDYAGELLKTKGYELIGRELALLPAKEREKLEKKLESIRQEGQRDLFL